MSKISIIKTELDSNPGLYGAMNDQQVADELNIVDKVRNRTSMSRAEIYENIESASLASLTSVQLDQLNLAMSDHVDPFGNVVQVFINVFGNPLANAVLPVLLENDSNIQVISSEVTSQTITNLAAARKETVSRAKIIGVPFVYAVNVENARNI